MSGNFLLRSMTVLMIICVSLVICAAYLIIVIDDTPVEVTFHYVVSADQRTTVTIDQVKGLAEEVEESIVACEPFDDSEEVLHASQGNRGYVVMNPGIPEIKSRPLR